jgi:phosphoribosylformylglycinamidine synthase
MVGRLPDARRAAPLGFQRAGEHIALVGRLRPSPAASELAKLCGEPLPDGLPAVDVAAVAATHELVRHGVRDGLLSSAHDVAEGGLAVALAECCLAGGLGAEVELGEDLWEAIPLLAPAAQASQSPSSVPALLSAALFGEGPGGFLVSGSADALRELRQRSDTVPVLDIGRVGDNVLTIVQAGASAGRMLTLTLEELADAHSSLAALMQ